MRYTSDEQRRYAFRDWLRVELARLDFYQRRGDRYLVSEFARFATQQGARVEEVSLGRYLRDENPVLPTPESCRELARALDRHPAEVLMEAGYLTPEDFFYLPGTRSDANELRRQHDEIENYTYLPPAIRDQMKASIERQLQVQQYPSEPVNPDHRHPEQISTEILNGEQGQARSATTGERAEKPAQRDNVTRMPSRQTTGK